jgi:hypothetical protein
MLNSIEFLGIKLEELRLLFETEVFDDLLPGNQPKG